MDGDSKAVELIYYCPKVRTEVEDHEMVGSFMPYSTEIGCVKGSEVCFCRAEGSFIVWSMWRGVGHVKVYGPD